MSPTDGTDGWSEPDAVAATAPEVTGLMQGFPPPPGRRVAAHNWLEGERVRWAVRHTRELMPTAEVRRDGPVVPLEPAPAPLANVTFADAQGRARTLEDYLTGHPVDGFLVLHRGRVLVERYPGGMRPHELHTLASVTKSITGVLVHLAIDEGVLSPDRPLAHWVPELAGTPVGEATLRRNLDMAVPIRFPEDQPFNLGYWAAAGVLPQVPGGPSSVYEFVARVGTADPAPEPVFQYQSSSPEAVTWALQRATGAAWQDLLSERLWGPIGAERDAFTVLDRAGMPMAAGGLSTTLRDLGRFGLLLAQDGAIGHRQVVPSRVVAALFEAADNQAAFAAGNLGEKSRASGLSYGYRNYWYQTGGRCPAWQAHGILSQFLHVAPDDDLVIAQMASTGFERPTTLPAFNRLASAITDAVRGRPG